MKCTKCEDEIEKGKVAWLKCKPYCSLCFEGVKQRTKTARPMVQSYWERWIEKQIEVKNKE